MRRLFSEYGFTPDLCLPAEQIRLFRDEVNAAPDAAKMKEVIALAEKELAEPIPACPASLYIRFAVDGNRSAYEAVYFRRRTMALRLSLAEAYEKQGRFTEKLADVVWAIMEESSWTIPAHLAGCSPSHGDMGLPSVFGDGRLHAVDLFSASTAALASLVYHMNKEALDAFSPAVCEKLKYEVNDRLFTPFLRCDFWWTGMRGNKVNNWNPWIISNVLFAAAVTADDDTLKAVAGRAAAIIDNYTACLPEDGGCDEGPSYWRVAAASYFDALELFYDITGGKFDLFCDPLVKAMCEYEPKMHIHGDRFLNFADCAPRVHPDGCQLIRMGRKCGSEMLTRFGETVAAREGLNLSSDCVYRTLRNLATPAPVEARPFGLCRAWIPGLGIMTAREYEDTGRGLFVAMKGGHNGESHNHNDVGSVIVCCDGEPVLIDAGCGTYCRQTFSPQRYELWYMQSAYHNVPDIGGKQQPQGEEYRATDEAYDPRTGSLMMQLRDAYPPEVGVRSYTRETVLTDGTVRITDAFELDGEEEVDLHFLTCGEPRPGAPGELKLVRGATMRFDPRLTARIEVFPVEDGTLERDWGTPTLWRIHLTASVTKAAFVTVIESPGE